MKIFYLELYIVSSTKGTAGRLMTKEEKLQPTFFYNQYCANLELKIICDI